MIYCQHLDGPVTIVHVAAEEGSLLEGTTGQGVARCRRGDVYVPELGVLIALGRAIQDMGRKVEKLAVEASFSEADLDRTVAELERMLTLALMHTVVDVR